jgi:hypothetical protein
MFAFFDSIVDAAKKIIPNKEPFRSLVTSSLIVGSAYLVVKTGLTLKKLYTKSANARAVAARRKDQKPDVAYIVTFPLQKLEGEKNLVQLSNPCARVELYCQLKNIPFERFETMDAEAGNPETGRLPCVELNGKFLFESKFIIDELEMAFNKGDNLSNEQEATLSVLLALCEDIRQWQYRSINVDNPEYLIDLYTKMSGYPRRLVKQFVMSSRKNVIASLNASGAGDVSDEQYPKLFLEDVKALEFFLSKHKFVLTDDKPSKADALVGVWVRSIRRPKELASSIPAFAFAIESAVFTKYLESLDAALEEATAAANNNKKSS